MSRKLLWFGSFSYEGETHVLYCRANNEKHAFSTLCVQLARKLKLSSWAIRQYYWNTNKYTIKLENDKKGEQ